MNNLKAAGAAALLGVLSVGAVAQMLPNPYGVPINLDAAKKVAAVALGEAVKNNWKMAVAVVDPAGILIYYEKMDNTQLGSADGRWIRRERRRCISGRQNHFRTHWHPGARACAFWG